MIKKIVILSILAAVLVWGLLSYWAKAEGPLAEDTTVVIARGASVKSIAREMENVGIIDKPWLFEVLARANSIDRKIKAGEYYVPAKASINEVLAKLERGEVFYRRVTIPEGLTISQVYELLREQEYLSGEISLDLSEGAVLAETYTFSRGDSRDSILEQAKRALETALASAWETRTNMNLKNGYEALVLASIIEKETAIAEERGLVASVFANRLRIGMRLQTDPTVIYALTNGEGYLGRSLKKADLAVDSPYNTYIYAGLPPTPICVVGRDAIEAAMSPEESKFIYFVADGNGGHQFSETYKEHQGKVAEWVKKIRSAVN